MYIHNIVTHTQYIIKSDRTEYMRNYLFWILRASAVTNNLYNNRNIDTLNI